MKTDERCETCQWDGDCPRQRMNSVPECLKVIKFYANLENQHEPGATFVREKIQEILNALPDFQKRAAGDDS